MRILARLIVELKVILMDTSKAGIVYNKIFRHGLSGLGRGERFIKIG